MEMTFEKREVPCLFGAVQEVQNSEQTQELRLPDGMPEIGKVLCAWGQVILRGKEWRSDSILVTGGMLMWVLYMPEDGSSAQVVDGWLPFQMRWSLPEDCREGEIRVTALTRFADARSVSPRKLMLRAGIGILAEAWAPKELPLWEPGELTGAPELLKLRHPVRLPQEAGEKAFLLEEELNTGIKPEKLLYYTLRPEITEQKVLANKIAFRGSGNLHAVWMGEDGAVTSQDFALPFSQFAELKGSFGSDAQVDVRCCVTNLELENDESGTLQAKCAVAAQYLVDDVQLLETVADAYFPGGALSLEKQTLQAPAILERRTETVSTECAVPVNAVSVADLSFLPDFPRQYREEEGIAAEIPGTVQLLCYESEGTLRAASCRWEGKLMHSTGPETALRIIPETAAPQFSIGPDRITVRTELPLQMTATGGEGIPMVVSMQGTAPAPDPQRPSLILRRADTSALWDLAKACGSTMSAIRTANALQDEPRPGQMLLIPVV